MTVHNALAPAKAEPPPKLDVRDLLRGCREVILIHGKEEYRLKLTSSGKLILTK